MQHDQKRQLIVSAGDLEIFDSGTIFDVRLIDDGQVRAGPGRGCSWERTVNAQGVSILRLYQAPDAHRVGRRHEPRSD